MNFFALVFIITTTCVMLFKKETETSSRGASEDELKKQNIEDNLSIYGTYKLMWKLLLLAPVKQFILILLTQNVIYYIQT